MARRRRKVHFTSSVVLVRPMQLMARRRRKVSFTSAVVLVRPTQLRCPHFFKGVEQLERVKERATKMIHWKRRFAVRNVWTYMYMDKAANKAQDKFLVPNKQHTPMAYKMRDSWGWKPTSPTPSMNAGYTVPHPF